MTKLLGDNLDLIILKLEGEGKCLTSCTGCDEGIKSSTKGFSFEGLKEVINYSLENLVNSNARFFLYGKNVFSLDYYDELIEYVKENPSINFDFHLTTFLEEKDLEKLKGIINIDNLIFTFCQSYSTIDFDKLNKIIDVIKKSDNRNQIVIIAESNHEEIKKYFSTVEGNFELTLSKYPVFLNNRVSGVGLKKCLVLGNFIPKDGYIDINISMLLEILVNGDLRLHNYLCNLASIDITNIYKDKNEIIKDFKKFIYFYHKFHFKGSYEENCYKCIKKLNYSYKKF